MDSEITTVLENIFVEEHEPEAVFTALLPTLGEVLHCDRCFLYLRSPYTKTGKVVQCWRRSPEYPEIPLNNWTPEPPSLPAEDPMFAAALRAEESLFIEDVETANPNVVNSEFERKNFGHRALIHAHLCFDNLLWGVLQPCVFDHPRVWTAFDRFVISLVIQRLTPIAVAYVEAADIKRG